MFLCFVNGNVSRVFCQKRRAKSVSPKVPGSAAKTTREALWMHALRRNAPRTGKPAANFPALLFRTPGLFRLR